MAAEKALMSVEGVISAEVELDSCEARVSGSADFESLRKAVADVGFTLVER
jgi:copper chaperone CopZ